MAVTALAPSWQPSLFAWLGSGVDASFAGADRIELDGGCWAEHCPGWVAGSDTVFEELLGTMPWGQRRRWRYERRGVGGRLTPWHKVDVHHGEPHPVLEEARAALSARFGVLFDWVAVQLHPGGSEGPSWRHRRPAPEGGAPVVGLVLLGGLRTVLLRCRASTPWRPVRLGHGDLLVAGGETRWRLEHRTSRRLDAGPRMTVTFRRGGG